MSVKKSLNVSDGQRNVSDLKTVRVGTFMQNCFRLDSRGTVLKPLNPNVTQEKYISQEKVMLPNGYQEQLVEKDYPINSDSVTSFADGADYRNDPVQATESSPKRVNLGDITEAQSFLENPQNNARLFNDVKAKLNAYYSAISKVAQDSENAGNNNNNVENNNKKE